MRRRRLALLGALCLALAACAGPVGTVRTDPKVELTRFRGHPIVGAERSVHDAEEPSAVPAGVPAADDRVDPARPDA
jgi:hypothetical protein